MAKARAVNSKDQIEIFDTDAKNFIISDEGFATFSALATRTGVFKYRNFDGSVSRQYRPPEEVFNADSMRSLANKPVTNDHPSRLIDTTNTRDFMVGSTGSEVVRDGGRVAVALTLMDKATIDDVTKKGKVELSCGYNCVHDHTPGVTEDGQEYDLVQRDIVYNHLAVVDKGRAGSTIKIQLDSDDLEINLDSEDGLVIESKNKEKPKQSEDDTMVDGELKNKKEDAMPKITIGGVEQEVSEQFKKAFDSMSQDKKDENMDSLIQKKDQEISKLEAERDSLKSKLDAEDEAGKKAKSDAEFQERVNARVKLYKVAADSCDEEVVAKLDSLSDIEIKKEVIKSSMDKESSINLDEKDEHYISARFDIAMEEMASNKQQKQDKELGKKVLEVKDSIDSRREDVRMNAWKLPMGRQRLGAQSKK